jgi:hypothetical protein
MITHIAIKVTRSPGIKNSTQLNLNFKEEIKLSITKNAVS